MSNMKLLELFWVVLVVQSDVSTGHYDVWPQQHVVQLLSQKVDQLEAKLRTYESELQELRKLQPSVIFSLQHTGRFFNVTNQAIVLFDKILFNKGGGYSARHGEFTAPVSGLYHVSYRGWSYRQQAGFLHLLVNDISISASPVGDTTYESASSQSLVLHLQQGDILSIYVYSSGTILMMGEDRTTFMGYLIQAD